MRISRHSDRPKSIPATPRNRRYSQPIIPTLEFSINPLQKPFQFFHIAFRDQLDPSIIFHRPHLLPRPKLKGRSDGFGNHHLVLGGYRNCFHFRTFYRYGIRITIPSSINDVNISFFTQRSFLAALFGQWSGKTLR